jgi:hypothetical protein
MRKRTERALQSSTGQRPGFESGQDGRPGSKVQKRENHIPDENGNLAFPENESEKSESFLNRIRTITYHLSY